MLTSTYIQTCIPAIRTYIHARMHTCIHTCICILDVRTVKVYPDHMHKKVCSVDTFQFLFGEGCMHVHHLETWESCTIPALISK